MKTANTPVLGDTPNTPLFSIKAWTHKLFALHGGARHSLTPFFVAPGERQHPLTYQTGMRHVRDLWAKASSEEEAMKYGLHSLRVLGYTLAKRGAGETLAVAQGGWRSDTHERYERFTVAQVLALPSAMLEADASGSLIAAAVPVAPSVSPQTPPRLPPTSLWPQRCPPSGPCQMQRGAAVRLRSISSPFRKRAPAHASPASSSSAATSQPSRPLRQILTVARAPPSNCGPPSASVKVYAPPGPLLTPPEHDVSVDRRRSGRADVRG